MINPMKYCVIQNWMIRCCSEDGMGLHYRFFDHCPMLVLKRIIRYGMAEEKVNSMMWHGIVWCRYGMWTAWFSVVYCVIARISTSHFVHVCFLSSIVYLWLITLGALQEVSHTSIFFFPTQETGGAQSTTNF